MLVTLPVMLLIMDYWPLQRFSRAMLRSLLMEKLPFLCLSTASSIVTFLVQKVAVMNLDELPFPLRVVNAIISYLAYLGKTVWPAKLVIFYPHPITYPAYQVILSSAGLAFITIMVAAALPAALSDFRLVLVRGYFAAGDWPCPGRLPSDGRPL